LGEGYNVVSKFKGKELVGKEYERIFSYHPVKEKGWYIVGTDFVTTEDGSGIVHMAPAYGEDDYQAGRKFGLPTIHPVNKSGEFGSEVTDFAGKFVKDADADIITNLRQRGILFKKEQYLHSYPHCWRCTSPLLYYARESWYIKTTDYAQRMIELNKTINWIPREVGERRFGNWLEENKDWALSRDRFWGTPLPIWICEKCGHQRCVGSIEELNRGKNVPDPLDLHKPFVDEITFGCAECGGLMRRTPELIDVWFDSGSMPFAQHHYPFANKEKVDDKNYYPADFIAEGMDQTRGWFYTLHVLATALTSKEMGLGTNKPAFKNVITNGLLLAADGRKLSKRLKNYTPPEEIIKKFGADTLRFFLLTSTAIGEDYLVADKRIEETYRQTISTLWHTFSFFKTYADKTFKPNKNFQPEEVLDCWIISRLSEIVLTMTEAMEKYDLTEGSRPIISFVDDLSNWYVRRSRRRFQKPENRKEKNEATQTLYLTLLTLAKLIAPFIPFLAEEIYLGLKKSKMSESVHLCDWPEPDKKLSDKKLEEKMTELRQVVAQVLAQRAAAGLKVRQPLASLKIKNQKLKTDKELLELIKDEVNVKAIIFDETLKDGEVKLDTKITMELKAEGLAREIVRSLQDMRKEAGLARKDAIFIAWSASEKLLKNIFTDFGEYMKAESLAREILAYDKKDKYLLEKTIELEEGKLKLGIKLKK